MTPHSGSPGPDSTTDLDSAQRLMTRFTAQLTTQLDRLGHGNRRGSHEGVRQGGRDRPPTLVAVAHGSRDPEALRTVTALLDRVRALRPGLPVRLGHIELNQPLLADTLAALRGEAVLVPLLLSRGYHTKQDIPDAVAAAPHLAARIAAPLGPDPLLAEALHARLAEAARRAGAPYGTGDGAPHGTGAAGVAAPHRAGVVLAAAGSRDPDAAVDVARTAALLSARLGGMPVLPGYASGSGPTVPEAVRALTALGHDRVAVASYFTAPGRFATQCANAVQELSATPRVAAAPLGAHPAVARLVVRRYEQAIASAPLSPPAATVGV
ncbi:sirohydrochlorin chelatase [Streptomyces melanosporofaciens]|uniref:Sirohydrochlorin ferrochelatase n=1 Tax=Streptomyces melanosporofaciens TaxID=67327 RepID=A0A1H4MRN6_STRMJ|nr:sirohydrochlorin chelatase [Streptomyces melanosporofaciens]SEB85444.1 Sirohydrochlorin ferrochelatase [Streptomyces melanosporofaciens]